MAAGLGFKTFTTGEVLTAADTNGYLMQGILVFASSAARTAAITSPQEGQYSYLKDTNALEYYDGAAWVGAPVGDITAVTAGKGLTGGGSSGDVTVSLATTAKGDLVAGSGASTAAVLTVGNNGETLVADSSTSTGLRYTANFAAGKNKIINGDFGIWQRGTSFSTVGYPTYYADRFYGGTDGSGITRTVSQQTFTPGTAPVAGYEGKYFLRVNQSVAGTGSGYNVLDTRIEDVQTLAGQTATYSFWAKADAARTVTATFTQFFGTGGSGNVDTSLGSFSLTTSWQRFTVTFSVPSISGKTIGTGSSIGTRFGLPLNTVMSIDFWGLQLEAGSVATAFQTATGTIQGELAACRYYYRRNVATGNAYGTILGLSSIASSATGAGAYWNEGPMRAIPTSVEFSNIALADGIGVYAISNVVMNAGATLNVPTLTITSSGLTTYRSYSVTGNNNAAGYLAISAEL